MKKNSWKIKEICFKNVLAELVVFFSLHSLLTLDHHFMNKKSVSGKYTTSVNIQKTRYKKLVTHVEPHASAVSLLKRAENSAI